MNITYTQNGDYQLYKWVFRKFIVHSAQTGLYTKTQEYLQGISSDNITKK